MRRPFTCSRSSRSMRRGRIRSRRPATASSTCSCGCRRRTSGPATSCWRTRRSSRRCSAATRASNDSGRTSRRSKAVMRRSGLAAALAACLCSVGIPARADAQSRGVYPLGMTATGSGVTPDSGFTYANQLLFYARDESKADDGATLPVSGQNAVVMDMNSFVWVSRATLLGGARYSMVATLPVAKNQLVSDIHGQLSGGGGLADSYYLPVVLGWNGERVSVRALAGFLAPTGRFSAGASDNVGSGYWTPTLSSGQTVHLTRSQSITVSAFELYEWHTTQDGSGTKPGGTIN